MQPHYFRSKIIKTTSESLKTFALLNQIRRKSAESTDEQQVHEKRASVPTRFRDDNKVRRDNAICCANSCVKRKAVEHGHGQFIDIYI